MDRDIWTQAENQLIKELELCVWDDPPSIYGRGWDTGTLSGRSRQGKNQKSKEQQLMIPMVKPATTSKNPDGTYTVRIQHTTETFTEVNFPNTFFAETLANSYAAMINGAEAVKAAVADIAPGVQADAQKVASAIKADTVDFVTEAKKEADELRSNAKVLFNQAKEEAEKLLASAKTETAKLLVDAKAEARKIINKAKGEAESIRLDVMGRKDTASKDTPTPQPKPAAKTSADDIEEL